MYNKVMKCLVFIPHVQGKRSVITIDLAYTKVKIKVHPITGHQEPREGVEV
jgi:hypothetical protein